MASSLEETNRTVDSIQCVGASENVTRQPRALHDIEVELAQTKQQPCDTIRYVGKQQNLILPPRMSLMEFAVKRR